MLRSGLTPKVPESGGGRGKVTPRSRSKCPTPNASASRPRSQTPSSSRKGDNESMAVERSKRPGSKSALKIGTKMSAREALLMFDLVQGQSSGQKSKHRPSQAQPNSVKELLETIRSQSQPQPSVQNNGTAATATAVKLRPTTATAKNLFNCDESAISISIPATATIGGDSDPLPNLSDLLVASTPHVNLNSNSTFSSTNSTVIGQCHTHPLSVSKVTIRPETLETLKKYGDLANEVRSVLATTFEKTRELESVEAQESLESVLSSNLLNTTFDHCNRVNPLIQKYLNQFAPGYAEFKSKLQKRPQPGIPCEFGAKLQTVNLLEGLGETCKMIEDELNLDEEAENQNQESPILENILINSTRENLVILEQRINSWELALDQTEKVQSQVFEMLGRKEFKDTD